MGQQSHVHLSGGPPPLPPFLCTHTSLGGGMKGQVIEDDEPSILAGTIRETVGEDLRGGGGGAAICWGASFVIWTSSRSRRRIMLCSRLYRITFCESGPISDNACPFIPVRH